MSRLPFFWKRYWQEYGGKGVVLGMMLIAFVMVTWPNIHDYLSMVSMMFDLGNMSQATWSVLRGAPLVYSTPEFQEQSRLAYHAEVIYVLCAPLLKIWPSPLTLILFQSLLYVSGGWAFFRLGKRVLGSEGGGVLGAFLYLFYPVAQTAAVYQFHGDTLSMPLLGWALESLEAKKWHRYAGFIMLALLSKVYVSLAVALLGVVLWLRGERKAALGTILGAAFWGGVVVLGFWNWFSPQWSGIGYLELRYVDVLPRSFDEILGLWVVRFMTALVVFGPVVWLLKPGWLWLLPGLVIAILSIGTGSIENVHYATHHYALAVPFLVWSVLKSGQLLRRRGDISSWRLRSWGVVLTTVGINLSAISTFIIWPHFQAVLKGNLRQVHRGQWVLKQVHHFIPANAPVLASPTWATHLSLRSHIYTTITLGATLSKKAPLSLGLSRVDFALVDGFFEYKGRANPLLEREALKTLWNDPAFTYLNQWDGVVLFQRLSQEAQETEQRKRTCLPSLWNDPRNLYEGLALYGVKVKVVNQTKDTITLLGCYQWKIQKQDSNLRGYAVSVLEGLPLSRGLHLDTWVSHPPGTWEDGVYIEEVYWTVPRQQGCYPLVVGWYDPEMPYLAASDEALIGNQVYLGTLCMGENMEMEWFPFQRATAP